MGTPMDSWGSWVINKYAKKRALAEGRASQAAAYNQADRYETEAVSDSRIAGDNMMRMRQNQNSALAAGLNQQAASGFDGTGSGQLSRISAADKIEQQIRDYNQANRNNDYSKRFAAENARYQGDLNMQAARSVADQYKLQADNALGTAVAQTAMLGAGAAMGYMGVSPGDSFGKEYWDDEKKQMVKTGMKRGGYQSSLDGLVNAYSLTKYVPGSYGVPSQEDGRTYAAFLNDLFRGNQ